jgi:FRG domain
MLSTLFRLFAIVKFNYMQINNFDKAEDFLSFLRLSKAPWVDATQWNSNWIFRGQSCSTLDLAPTLYREKNQHLVIAKLKEFVTGECERMADEHFKGKEENAVERENFKNGLIYNLIEFKLITDFVNYSDGAGLEMPRLDEFRTHIRHGNQINWGNPHIPHPIVGFAQHHGVPTRLLDWTKNPLYAAFFAVSSIKPDDDEGTLTVWAIRSDVLTDHTLPYKMGTENVARFEIMEVKKSENRFLFSQEGLFTYNRQPHLACWKNGEFPKIENYLNAIGTHLNEVIWQKITLPKTERRELKRLLHVEGISQVRLMPFYDNVIRTMQLNYTA